MKYIDIGELRPVIIYMLLFNKIEFVSHFQHFLFRSHSFRVTHCIVIIMKSQSWVCKNDCRQRHYNDEFKLHILLLYWYERIKTIWHRNRMHLHCTRDQQRKDDFRQSKSNTTPRWKSKFHSNHSQPHDCIGYDSDSGSWVPACCVFEMNISQTNLSGNWILCPPGNVCNV